MKTNRIPNGLFNLSPFFRASIPSRNQTLSPRNSVMYDALLQQQA